MEVYQQYTTPKYVMSLPILRKRQLMWSPNLSGSQNSPPPHKDSLNVDQSSSAQLQISHERWPRNPLASSHDKREGSELALQGLARTGFQIHHVWEQRHLHKARTESSSPSESPTRPHIYTGLLQHPTMYIWKKYIVKISGLALHGTEPVTVYFSRKTCDQ